MSGNQRSLYNPNLELAVLRQLFPDEYGHYRHAMLAHLREESFFYEPAYNAFLLYRHHTERAGQEPDWLTILDDARLSSADRTALMSFNSLRGSKEVHQFHSEVSAVRAATKLGELAYLRRCNAVNRELNDVLFDPEMDVSDVVNKLAEVQETLSTTLDPEDDKIYSFGENTDELEDWLLDEERESAFYTTPFPTFNDAVGGIPQTGFGLLAAVTSGGKSAMANKLQAYWAGEVGLRVCKVSLEMPAPQEYMRFCAQLAHVPLRDMKEGKTMSAAQRAAIRQTSKEWKARMARTGGCLDFYCVGSSTLERTLMRLQPRNYDIIIYDYIGLLEGADDEKQALMLSRITRSMKSYTQKHPDKLIIGLAQLDEDSTKIRYSRAMKEHADFVWIWYPSEAEKVSGEFPIHQIKGRDNGLFSWMVRADWTYMDFTDMGSCEQLDPEAAQDDENGDMPIQRRGGRGARGRRDERRKVNAQEDATLSG